MSGRNDRVARRNTVGHASRSHPYARDPQPREEEEDDDPNMPANAIKVSGTYPAKHLAEAICLACREGGDLPPLMTIGNNSVNQAVKGIAIAHAELQNEGIALAFQPAFRHENRTRARIAFYLSTSKTRRAPAGADDESTHLTVSGGNAKIVAIAGAVSGRVRDNDYVIMTAIGVDAVSNAVLASGNARLFLEKDGLDIKIEPTFFKSVKPGQGEINGIMFTCKSERI